MSIPKRPYLLRALHEWIVDAGLTPYLLVSVESEQVQVPSDYVSDGKIVLNIAGEAVRDLQFDNDSVSFSGRFGGRPFPIFIPMASVQAIYAKESGEGMMFEPEYEKGGDEPDPPGPPTPEKLHLKVVK